MRRRALVASALCLFALPACSLVVAGDVTQCDSSLDCQARGLEFASTACIDNQCVPVDDEVPAMHGWDCVGNLPPIRIDYSRTVELSLRLTDLKSAGRPDLAVNYCYTLDPSCTSVLSEDVLSDEDGRLVLEMPFGIKSIVVITGDSSIVPTLVYVNPPPVAPISNIFVPVLDVTTVALMSQLTGKAVVPDTGMVLVSTADCALEYNPFTPGVKYELSAPGPDTVPFYLVNERPDPTATITGPNGVGGFANVPPGLVAISASVPDFDNLDVGHGNFLVRENWLTYATISPYDH